MDSFQGEFHALALKAHPEYRVVRQVDRPMTYGRKVPEHAKMGVLLHVDTTGPDPDVDEIIGLTMVRFAYTDTGTLFGPLEVFSDLQQPKKPIPPHVTRATGISPADVKGRSITKRFVGDVIQKAELIVCHGAGRARRFCERFHPDFQHKAWACSRVQIPWSHEGIGCSELAFIAYRQGFFYEGHTTYTLFALLQILEMPLPTSGRITMAKLIEAAKRETCQVWAIGASYEVREPLRDRGYTWHGGHDGRYRAWFTEVDPANVEEELRFLDSLDVPDLAPLVTTVDATLRFSDRLF